MNEKKKEPNKERINEKKKVRNKERMKERNYVYLLLGN